MEIESENTKVTSDSSKKRKRQPEKWKTNVKKKLLYSAKTDPVYPNCSHNTTYECCLLTYEDIRMFHALFYDIPEKCKQDAFILKHVSAFPPQRVRKDKWSKSGNRKKDMSLKYRIVCVSGIERPVCRATFLSALQITKHRVLGVLQRLKLQGAYVPVETRGGSRKEMQFGEKRKSVINFIQELKGVESHYSRGKSKRIYLSSELNITKLWKIYDMKADTNLKVKQGFFRMIFTTQFNIRFGTPTTDECSTCIEIEERLKVEKDEEVLKELEIKKLHHNEEASSFFGALKIKQEECLLLNFDCQKNLVLPKVSDQTACNSRHLYCYNLAVVCGEISTKPNPENVSIYTWTEDQAKKSSNEVASIVYNELQCKVGDHKSVRLVADGCPGQTKNLNVLAMCSKWLLEAPEKVETIELLFPVVGHPYMPSDRVFGLIEKELRTKETIINASEYHDVFKKFGIVKIIGKDWKPYDWKSEASLVMKETGQLHFEIEKCKRFVITKTADQHVLIRGESSYNVDTGVSKPVLKKGWTSNMINPPEIHPSVPVDHLKIIDVKNLLQKHFGDKWETIEIFNYYRNVIQENTNSVTEEENCECHD